MAVHDGDGDRILVVEDERIVALDLSATLRELGYRVAGSAASGEDAVVQARTLSPDLVLMDIRLGGDLDGIGAAAAIKRERDVPVIYLTAHTDDETLRRAKATEPLAYLVKPFRVPELRCAIELALHRHEINTTLRAREEQLTATLRAITTGLAAFGVDATPSAEAIVNGTDVAALNADLERRVLERVAELEAANRELEAFSAAVAHDLRSPLHWIDGFSQILLEDHVANLGVDGVGHLRRIRTAVAHMNLLIANLLELARVAGTELVRRPVDLSTLARGVITNLRGGDRDRRVDVVIADDLVVDTDETLAHVVLQNLLGNAWKFTAKAASARLELGRTTIDGAEVFFVRDNGAGFDPAFADRLFGAFKRLHAVADFDGTGLGLAIVRRAVERVEGRIWAEGETGRGATFFFTLAPPP